MTTPGGLQAGVPADETADPQLSTDTVFKTLGNRRRRYILHNLRRHDGPVPIRELSEQLAAWEQGKERAAVTPKERKRLYTALHQTHLPKMDSLEVVEYDRNRGTVSLTEHTEEFDVYLDVVPRRDLAWSQFYLALGTVLSALVTIAMLGIAPFDALGGFVYALGVCAVLVVMAAYHTLRDRRLLLGSTELPPEALAPVSDGVADDDD